CLYKTGDLVKYTSNLELIYVGRNDSQIKIRGLRLELGEIENALNQYTGIKQSLVNIIKQADQDYLLAYYIADNKIDKKLLHKYLSSKLPDYMVPRDYVHLVSLPLTVN